MDASSLVRDPGLRPSIWEIPPNKRDEIRRAYIDAGPYQPKLSHYKPSGPDNRRRFRSSWYENHRSWLEYSVEKNVVFCLPCYLFSKKPTGRFGEDAFTTKGFDNWKKVGIKDKCKLLHEGKVPNSPHKMAVKKCEDLMHYSGHIDNLIDKKTEKQKSDSHLRLIATIDCVRFLLYQAQPFRGHDESEDSDNRENFIELLTLLSHYNHDLAQVVLENAPKNQKYTSPTIQKDIIRIFANKVRNAILEEVGNAKFCIIVDEARDESKREQMAIILRFVDKMGCIRECFFAIVHIKDTRASTLKDSICDVLTHNNLQVENIRGQGYDGASNMRGVWNGLQALICRECPYAYYVHCFAHRLQLALVATASREVHVVHEFFGQMTYIINVVVGSTKRHDELRDAQAIELEKLVAANEIQTGRGKNQIGTLLRAGDTRWSSHYRCICSVIKMYNVSLTVLLNMKNEGRDYEVRGNAAVAMKMMGTFEFILCLHLMEEIMRITNILSQALQLQTRDILNAVDLVTTCKSLLQKMRDVGWEPLLAKVLSFCEQNNIDIPDLSNLCSNGRGLPHRRNQNSITLEHHLRIDLFIASVDFQLRELNSRFSDSSLEILVLSSALNPRDGFKSFEVNKLCMLADKFYPEDFSEQERVQLRLQLEYYGLDVIKHPEFLNLSSTSDLCQKLYMTKKSINYRLINRLIRLVLTLPVSTATTERAFSDMKLVKTKLRNRMEDDYLADSLIVYIEKNICRSFTSEMIMSEFYSIKPRR